MKRPYLLRLSALWAALLLALTWGADAFRLHVCPHHDVVAAQAGHMSHGAAAHAGHADHGDHGQAPDHQGCTCIGCCHAGTVALVPDAGALAVRASVSRHAAPPARRDGTALPAPPPYLLPYSTAPPVS